MKKNTHPLSCDDCKQENATCMIAIVTHGILNIEYTVHVFSFYMIIKFSMRYLWLDFLLIINDKKILLKLFDPHFT